MDAGKLVGTLQAPGRGGQSTETKIEDAKVTGDELTFSVTRETQAAKIVMKYTGKIAGDTIKGKVATTRDGEAGPERDWEAKRAAAAKEGEKKL
jgi:hypothetical protein